MREELREIRDLLSSADEHSSAAVVSLALDATDAGLEKFLVSNELWGGSGSIADQCLIDQPDLRRQLESALIKLGRAQVRAGLTNPRTLMWTETFEQWRQGGAT